MSCASSGINYLPIFRSTPCPLSLTHPLILISFTYIFHPQVPSPPWFSILKSQYPTSQFVIGKGGGGFKPCLSNFFSRSFSFIPFSLLKSVAVNSDSAFSAVALPSSEGNVVFLVWQLQSSTCQFYSFIFCTTFPLGFLAVFFEMM